MDIVLTVLKVIGLILLVLLVILLFLLLIALFVPFRYSASASYDDPVPHDGILPEEVGLCPECTPKGLGPVGRVHLCEKLPQSLIVILKGAGVAGHQSFTLSQMSLLRPFTRFGATAPT